MTNSALGAPAHASIHAAIADHGALRVLRIALLSLFRRSPREDLDVSRLDDRLRQDIGLSPRPAERYFPLPRP